MMKIFVELARYELSAGRVRFHGAEANLADAIQKLTTIHKAARRLGSSRCRPCARRAARAAPFTL